jgi:hypothetical protein
MRSPHAAFASWGAALSQSQRAVMYVRNGLHGRPPMPPFHASLAARHLYHSATYRLIITVVSVAYWCVGVAVRRCVVGALDMR